MQIESANLAGGGKSWNVNALEVCRFIRKSSFGAAYDIKKLRKQKYICYTVS